MRKKAISKVFAVLLLASACAEQPTDPTADVAADDAVLQPMPCNYHQAFGTGAHGGRACAEQRGMKVVSTTKIDSDADQEASDNGFLQIHYGWAVTDGDFVVTPVKRGYGGNGINADGTVSPRPAEIWSLSAFQWSAGVMSPSSTLVPAWTVDTAWEPIDTVIGSFGSYTNGYLQEFTPAVANGSVYSLGQRGTLERRALKTGALQATINPLLGNPIAGDPLLLAVAPPSVDESSGTLYYTITAFPTSGGRGAQPRGSWLAIVHPDNSTQVVPWAQIASSAVGVPQSSDLCAYQFGTSGTPQPTGPDSQPPQFGCGTQRPAFNVGPAIGNGELVVASAANNQIGAEFLISVSTSTLQPTAAYDTRFRMLTGCGVRLDIAGGNCPVITANGTTNIGNDPRFNKPTSFTASDIMNNAPVIATNGDLSIGGYDSGFSFGGNYDARGGIVTFRRSLGGSALSINDDFGWEVTPALIPHALPNGLQSFTYAADRNLYSDGVLGTAEYGPDWSLRNHSEPAIDPNAVAIDFLDNQTAVDVAGNRYGIDGSGTLYKFAPSGAILESIILPGDDGVTARSIETESNPISRDQAGRLYVVYGGRMYVVAGSAGSPGGTTPTARRALAPEVAQRLAAQRAAKSRASANAPQPIPFDPPVSTCPDPRHCP